MRSSSRDDCVTPGPAKSTRYRGTGSTARVIEFIDRIASCQLGQFGFLDDKGEMIPSCDPEQAPQ
ncbi:MAG: hypothetical protein K2X93_29595 [Candidatus Obscuribacterales bacterium]|nr:hypothetical protein [Candidatus Obscuribacterales bacterium]